MSPDVKTAADALVPVPLHPAAARRALSAARLDVLVFADTTSEPLAWCLSLGRLAPVQAAFWGNPTTTGHGDAVDIGENQMVPKLIEALDRGVAQ